MSLRVAGKALAVWVGILILAVLNGILRENALTPHFGSTAGFVLSGLFLSALIVVVACLSLPWLGARRPAELIGIGLGWVALTLVFEFSFGLWQGKSWQVMLEAYTFRDGNIWPIVLIASACAPCLAARVRRVR
ncbi:hypothetical protein [Halofilum ochraceum]|uniref:hypothetical protein n=1 Tax=Halofilum ochraceum TaxID=1611323 RepID=UPI0009F3D948|nr:hypothetical protein [Halofilum ochraceum]